MPETKLFAVAGDPILHSLSPEIFKRLFRTAGMNAVYFRLAAENGREVMDAAKAMGLAGANITSPFKEAVLPYLEDIDGPARAIGAVNGIVARLGGFAGFNTDHIGVIEALRSGGVSPEGRKAVVLGAGGAARAAAYALLRAGAAKVTLVNRSVARAKAAVRRLGCDHCSVKDSGPLLRECDICVSCLPPGIGPPAPPALRTGCTFLAAGYRRSILPRPDPEGGPLMIDGREWLLHQAIPSFRLLSGRKAPESLRDRAAWKGLDRAPSPKPNVALVGFSGAGKTTVGRSLAKAMGFGFADTDTLVEERAGMSVAEIFRTRGESGFRELERAVIHDAIPAAGRTVFSIGGGGLGRADNRSVVERHCLVVWIWASLRAALERVRPGSRPLLDHDAGGAQAEELFSARLPVYARASDMAIVGEKKPVARIVRRIKNEIDQAFAD
jgi:shikimate dehydrogenase